jgi:hypothetical protein
MVGDDLALHLQRRRELAGFDAEVARQHAELLDAFDARELGVDGVDVLGDRGLQCRISVQLGAVEMVFSGELGRRVGVERQ